MGGRRRHSPDQIIRKLTEGNKVLAGGMELEEVSHYLEIAESTAHRWTAQCGWITANDPKRLKELKVENTGLKKLLAEAELDKGDGQGDRRRKVLTPNRRRRAVEMLHGRFAVSERSACQVPGWHRYT